MQGSIIWNTTKQNSSQMHERTAPTETSYPDFCGSANVKADYKRVFKKGSYLYSLLLQQNYQVWVACPQIPTTRCVCPPGGRRESLGLLPGAGVWSRRDKAVTCWESNLLSFRWITVKPLPVKDVWHGELAQIGLFLQQVNCVDEGLQRSPKKNLSESQQAQGKGRC